MIDDDLICVTRIKPKLHKYANFADNKWSCKTAGVVGGGDNPWLDYVDWRNKAENTFTKRSRKNSIDYRS